MLSPCFIGVNDFQRCFAFYAEVMAVLGHQLRFSESDRPWAGWQQPGVARARFSGSHRLKTASLWHRATARP